MERHAPVESSALRVRVGRNDTAVVRFHRANRSRKDHTCAGIPCDQSRAFLSRRFWSGMLRMDALKVALRGYTTTRMRACIIAAAALGSMWSSAAALAQNDVDR